MADKSKIEWTEATWNPLAGCTKVSPGCAHCYAETMAKRLKAMGKSAYQNVIDEKGRWNGQIELIPGVLEKPLRWKRPRKIFVDSMSDLFHEQVSDDYIHQVFDVMIKASWHTFQVLTKRADRMADLLGRSVWWAGTLHEARKHIWLGVSVEDQKRADERIPALLKTPAEIRFLSCEPLLGPVYIQGYLLKGWHKWDPKIKWVIAGGESGPDARPMHPDWARSLRDQCQTAGTAFLFKQWGAHQPVFGPGSSPDLFGFVKVGKHAAGRLLDGREWNEYPDTEGQGSVTAETENEQ